MMKLVRVKSLKKDNQVLWNPLSGRWNQESSKSKIIRDLKKEINSFVEGNEYSLKLPEDIDFEDLDTDIKNILRPLLVKKTHEFKPREFKPREFKPIEFKPREFNIVGLLDVVRPDLKINSDGKKILNTFLDKLLFIINSKGINTIEKLYEFIDDFMIGQLKKYSLMNCKKRLIMYKENGHTLLKFKHTDDEFNIACMSLLEYLAEEILYEAGSNAKKMRRRTIKNTDLFESSDQELVDLSIKVSKTVKEIENKNLVELSKIKKRHLNFDTNILNKISDFYRLY